MTDPIIHEVREKSHRLIVGELRSRWVNTALFARLETSTGEGYMAAPLAVSFTGVPEIFFYKSVYATEVKPTEIQPVEDEDLPTI